MVGPVFLTGEAGSAFNRWLESQLALALDHHAFTFVALHAPPLDRQDDGYLDDLATLRHQAELFHRYRVTAVFSGHNHLFAHHEIEWQVDGESVPVTYIISGGGGQSRRNAHEGKWNNRHAFGFKGETIFSTSAYHFLRVDVNGADRSVALTAFDINGDVIYGPFEKRSPVPVPTTSLEANLAPK